MVLVPEAAGSAPARDVRVTVRELTGDGQGNVSVSFAEEADERGGGLTDAHLRVGSAVAVAVRALGAHHDSLHSMYWMAIAGISPGWLRYVRASPGVFQTENAQGVATEARNGCSSVGRGRRFM